MNISNEDIQKIKDFLLVKLSPSLIFLFGSAAEGNFRAESDVDIAFLPNVAVDRYDVFLLAQEIATSLGRDVDLINLREASTVFIAQIVSKGEVIYSKDKNFEAEFIIRALKQYALLNEERAVIVDRIKEEGKIY